MDLLYKYRSLDNWEFLLDILVNHRLYASSYLDLNDPMEGYYRYASDSGVSKGIRTSLEQEKEAIKAEKYDKKLASSKRLMRICSLSEEPHSTLMWSYYSGGHTGVAIGVEQPSEYSKRKVRRVLYDNTITLNSSHQNQSIKDLAVEILSRKLYSWSHEKEVRVFTEARFVNKVKIRELLLGCRISRERADLVTSLAGKYCPGARIRKLTRSDLIRDY